jgi:hypothetical protein
MTREEIRARIEEIGIIPAIRVSSAEDALFAAEAVSESAIPIVEVTMTVPGAVEVIRQLTSHHPDVLVGAGTLFDADKARRCLDAGASFLTTPGLDMEIVNFALERGVVVFPGALTPTEVSMRLEGRRRFREGLSVLCQRRPRLHPGSQGALRGSPADCFRRRESDERHGFHSRRRGGAGHRPGPDSPGRHPAPRARLDHRTGAAVHQDRGGSAPHTKRRPAYETPTGRGLIRHDRDRRGAPPVEKAPKQSFEVTSTERVNFQPGGAIRLENSYGYLTVEGGMNRKSRSS